VEKALLTSSVLFLAACGATANDSSDAGVAPETTDAGPQSDAFELECEPPDFMVILDRTGSMSQRPDGTMPPNSAPGADETKWGIAVNSLETLAASREMSIRLGLVLFPLDPDGDQGTDCSNLDTWLTEYLPPESNDPVCMPAELLVSPVLGASGEIDAAIDRDLTGLCSYTPIGAGFTTAHEGLSAIKEPIRDQYALLITDGADTCDHRDTYPTKSLASADALRADGVKIFVVGFDGTGSGVDVPHLNDLACAGGTAPNFDVNCELASGVYRAAAASAARLFLLADDAISLGQALEAATSEVCCGCVD
jgi:hypothetical protein